MHRTKKRCPTRQAIALVEALVVLAFFAVATAAAMSVHRASINHDRVTTDRLRQRLAVENIAQQLRGVAYSDLAEQATALASQSGAIVTIDDFESDSRSGRHLTFVIDSEGGKLVHHLWRLEPQP